MVRHRNIVITQNLEAKQNKVKTKKRFYSQKCKHTLAVPITLTVKLQLYAQTNSFTVDASQSYNYCHWNVK